MKLRTSYFVIVAETGVLLVIWAAFRDAVNGMQHMSNVIADHRCAADVTVTAELHRVPSSPISYDHYHHYVPGEPLVQPALMTDPALARNPHTLGGSK
jgi:hypothetical protein